MASTDGLDRASVERLRELDRMLKELGNDRVLRRAILKDLRAPALAVAARQRAAVRSLGGSAPSSFKAHAAANIRVIATLSGSNPRVAVILRRSSSGPSGRPGWTLNEGRWRHPVFGNSSRWASQSVAPPGWFDRTAQAARPQFQSAAGAALNRATEDLARRIDNL